MHFCFVVFEIFISIKLKSYLQKKGRQFNNLFSIGNDTTENVCKKRISKCKLHLSLIADRSHPKANGNFDLKLLFKGKLICQCNVTKVRPAASRFSCLLSWSFNPLQSLLESWLLRLEPINIFKIAIV